MNKTSEIKSLAKLGKYQELVDCWSRSEFDLAVVFERAVTDFRTVARNQGHQRILQFCIEQGLALDSRVDWLGQPLLCTAAMYGNSEFLNWVSERTVPDNNFVRASLGDVEYVASLSAEELNLRDANDWNMLHYVCASGLGRDCNQTRGRLAEVCDLLLQNGVNANHCVSNQVEITPALLCAWFGGDAAIMKKLLTKGGVDSTKLHQAVEFALEPHQRSGEPFLAVAKTILGSGFAINSIRPDQARTVLHGCANRGSVEAVRWLLKNGADPNVQDDQQRTPLHLSAIRNTHASVCKLLMEKGADPNAKDSDAKIPYQYAVENRRIKVADFLKAEERRG